MTPADVFPELRPWVENLVNVWPAYIIKPQFAQWQVLHILSMVILGGTSILINLRLIGVGVTNESPSEVYRNLRAWLHVGVVGIVVSGVLIGMANAERLYDSAAFTVKMLALLAGVILTYGASALAAKADGRVGGAAKVFFLLGLAVFAVALWVFSTGDLINPGMFHAITAAALVVLFVTRGPIRWIYLVGLTALLVAQYVATHIVIKADDYERLDPVNIAFAWIFAAWILGVAAFQTVVAGRSAEGGPIAKAIGYATILVWVVASAAGRWIAFA
ncbi:DUF6644 family protein [Phenylobacterium sp.]|jgi:hypothetical protein|uniref:DUF6644 family protein n=1 Tax=Phenylobacterium sp. TaxID=1871053 RepID=UPI002F953177